MRRYHNTSSVSAMLEELQWPSLADRRRTARLAMLYKITHNLAHADMIKEQLQLLPPRRRRVHNQQYVVPPSRTLYWSSKFFPAKNHQTVERTTPGGGRGQHHWHICVTGLGPGVVAEHPPFFGYFIYIFLFSSLCQFIGLFGLYYIILQLHVLQPVKHNMQLRPPRKWQNNQQVDCGRWQGRREEPFTRSGSKGWLFQYFSVHTYIWWKDLL